MKKNCNILSDTTKKKNYLRIKAGLFFCDVISVLPASLTHASNIDNIHRYEYSQVSNMFDLQVKGLELNDDVIIPTEQDEQDQTVTSDPTPNANDTLENPDSTNSTDQDGTDQNNDNQQDEPVYKKDNTPVYAKKSCNVYEEASKESNIIGKLILYKKYTRIGIGENGFDQIQYDDQIAYVLSKNITSEKPEIPEDIVDVTDKKYSYTDMEKDLQQLAKYYPDKVSVESIGTTLDNRKLYVAVLGNPDAKDHILIQGSMHAREYINTQLLMGLLEKYLKNYDKGTYDGISYKKMFSQVAVHFIPMVNPDGVTLCQYGLKGIHDKKLVAALKKMPGSSNFTRWKANANGVDLNKNFPYGFTKNTGVTKKSSMNYPGSKALSERETKAMYTYTMKIDGLRTVLSYHSVGNVIYWDYGQAGKLRTECKKLANLVRQQTTYRFVTVSYKKIHYGGFSDWSVRALGIPAVTIETGLLYAPVSHYQFNTIWKQNKNLIPEVIKNIINE